MRYQLHLVATHAVVLVFVDLVNLSGHADVVKLSIMVIVVASTLLLVGIVDLAAVL